ncbi:hypothetical protein Glove_420g6 [Diversispora epigaea]|uniref:Uncharacterized protein n=1 Tax=Diversispora epigaea TaxID=1348612 RepID=A0A397GXT6_9GLOM|nr:hypothetical protein Glove_420g6 [Diversispora epigaea]
MSKHKKYSITLISPGVILEDLHFGASCHNWWNFRPSSKTENLTLLFPIRLYMKTLINLNKRDFIIEVFTTTSEYGLLPGYICKCDGIRSELCQTLTVAICSVYRRIFGTETKFSGPAVMGFDTPTISNVLLQDLQFRPYFISLNKLRIWIMGIGRSNRPEWNFAGVGYKATFIYTFKKQRCVFVQEFEESECTLTIYTGANIKIYFFTECDPESLWKKVGILQQYNGKLLFGLEEPHTQSLIKILRIPSCTLNDWNNYDVMELIFAYHLKRRISTCINWQEFFNQWLTELSTIIELRSQLKKLYPIDHEINEREFRAWKTMLRNVGCVEITPFEKDQFKVEFWTRSFTPEIDKANLDVLYKQGFLILVPSHFKNNSKMFWNSFQESLDVNKRGIDGRTRILSIIRESFTYDEIKKNLEVSNDAVRYARKHARLYGVGGKAFKKPIITHENFPEEIQQQLNAFLLDKANVVMSSYKTDPVTGEPVHYLKHTKEALWKKYHDQYSNGMQRTSFFTRLQGKKYVYREDLGGLCQTCQKYGYEIFSDLSQYIEKHVNQSLIQKQFLVTMDNLKRFLKHDYENHFHVTKSGITFHNPCINHCLLYALGNCTEHHDQTCDECQGLFSLFENIKNYVDSTNYEEIEDLKDHLLYYLAHQTRKVYLNAQFNANLLELDEKTALILVNYKMKILSKTARETKNDWFGKKRWSLHTVMVYRKQHNSSILQVEAYDHWSADTRQDSWFTTSSLHAVLENLDPKPESIIIMSDNGGHYHNADLMMIVSFWPEWYNIEVKKWIFLEAGEAKTSIDSHHAQISHAINRYVRLGFDVQTGQDIENAIKGIRGTSVAHLQPNRDRGTGNNTLPGNSNWFEWQWPTTGDLDGCILARAVPNIGDWIIFTPAQLKKLQNREIEIPKPLVSNHTIQSISWEVPIPNSAHIRADRLSKEKLITQLQSKGIEINEKENKVELIKKLEIELQRDNICHNVLVDITNQKVQQNLGSTISKESFPLQLGWALKQNQKFGKKGAGKRMSIRIRTLLEGFFLAGNVNKSNHYTANDMYKELIKCAQEGEVDNEEVPKVGTIQNWINKMTRVHREEAAARVLKSNNT